MKPRCARPVRIYEKPGRAVLGDPLCGRPANHNGRCRSAASLARSGARRDQDRRNKQRRHARLHARLSAVIAEAVALAEARARAERPVPARDAA